MGFRTKLDYSDNRQIKQHIDTTTQLSGTTIFGVPFSNLPFGPDLTTSGISQSLLSIGSTFSGNNDISIFTWYDDVMQLGYPYLTAITPSNSATTQNVPPTFTAATTTIIDGNAVVLSYSGISYDLTAIAMDDLGGGNYSGTVVSNTLNFLSAGTLDFTGRTIWVDVCGTTRTNKLIVTDGAQIGSVLTCIDSDGTIGFGTGVSGTSTNYWTAGTNTDAILMINGSNISSGILSIAEGFGTEASGDYSHSEGLLTIASGVGAHSEGRSSYAFGVTSHAEGRFTTAEGDYTHTEGYGTTAIGTNAHAEGENTIASGLSSHAEGSTTQANGDNSHAEGVTTIALGYASHAEGATTQSLGSGSHAEGVFSIASGNSAHAEGFSNAYGDYSHSEGQQTQAFGRWSHVGGIFSSAVGSGGYAQGSGSSATGDFAHAEGVNTIASGLASHAEGRLTRANGDYTHAGGISTIASGLTSFVHGSGSTAGGLGTIVLGRGITGTTADTTYVDRLNIKTLGTGTSSSVLGIDVNGNFVTTTTMFTGGTVAGPTNFLSGVTANTISANTISASTSINIGSAKITEDLTNMGNASLSTGLYEFTNNGITITASTATTFNVGAVKGWIVNPQDILDTNPTFVNFSGSSGTTTPFLNTSVATYLLVNSASTLTLINSYPTPAQRRNNIFLGVVGHPSSGTTGIGIGNTPDLIMNEISQIRAMFSGIKFINDGIVCTANTGMTMTNTAGNILGFGISFIMSGNSTPSVISVNAATPTTFQYRTQTGQTFVNTTTISASTYDLSGTPTTIPITGTTATNQRIYILANGNIRIQFGQTIYYTLTEAVDAASSERFNVFANNRNLGVLIGILSVRRDCTNIADTNQARFLQVNKFGETVGASGGQVGGYLLASITCSANADQQLTTTAARVNFDTNDSSTYGGITRSGSTFVILSKGVYSFSFQPQITQNSNNNITTVWMGKNGVNVPNSAARASFAANGDTFVLPLTTSLELAVNDVITFSGVTSNVNGATLDFTAAAGSVPAIPAVILDIKGWKQ